jgi:hypothetical protein
MVATGPPPLKAKAPPPPPVRGGSWQLAESSPRQITQSHMRLAASCQCGHTRLHSPLSTRAPGGAARCWRPPLRQPAGARMPRAHEAPPPKSDIITADQHIISFQIS